MKISKIAVIGQKVGMTSLFGENGHTPVTLIKIPTNYVLGKKNYEGYTSLSLGVAGKSKHIAKPQKIELEKKSLPMCDLRKEFRIESASAEKIEEKIEIDAFADVKKVDITSKSAGKGFAGWMALGLKGQRASHGASLSHRSGGSTGTRDKIFKGKIMPKRRGYDVVTVLNLKVVAVDPEIGVIAISGSLPGRNGTWLSIKESLAG